MDKVQVSQREGSLKYLIGAFENEYGWLNSVKVNPNRAVLGSNASAMLQLGEALSAKKKATLYEYFENWYRAFKEYETVAVKAKPVSAAGVRKAFKSRFSKDKQSQSHAAGGDQVSHLSSEVSTIGISDQSTSNEEARHHHNATAPFPLDARIVFLCLCQTVLVMYEAIQELTVREWSSEEKDLYNKLDTKIKQLVIDPAVKMMDNDAKSTVQSERKFLKFMR